MRFFTAELWKGINGISNVYDIETAYNMFRDNIKKYNEYFCTEIAHFLTRETLELYKKHDGFHDMEITQLQYRQNDFCIYGKTLSIMFVGVKELTLNFINDIDTFGYMEIQYRKETDDFQIGLLFSWDDSINIICNSISIGKTGEEDRGGRQGRERQGTVLCLECLVEDRGRFYVLTK